MKKLGDSVAALMTALGVDNAAASGLLRAAAVNSMWEIAVESVFKEAAALVLEHTNAVYIMSGKQGGNLRRFDRPRSETQGEYAGKVLAIYSDDSLIRSELDNRQELLKMKFREQGEEIEAIKIIPSTHDMKNRHPFLRDENESAAIQRMSDSVPKQPPTEEEKAKARACAQAVEDPDLQKALYRAMMVDDFWRKLNSDTGE